MPNANGELDDIQSLLRCCWQLGLVIFDGNMKQLTPHTICGWSISFVKNIRRQEYIADSCRHDFISFCMLIFRHQIATCLPWTYNYNDCPNDTIDNSPDEVLSTSRIQIIKIVRPRNNARPSGGLSQRGNRFFPSTRGTNNVMDTNQSCHKKDQEHDSVG